MVRSQPDAPTVMVVDDTAAVRIVLWMQLIVLGYRVLEARNGAEAVELGGRERPDLILMDISMPVLDGLEATRLLRSSPAERQAAMEAGCTDLIAKPLGKETIELIIERYLRGA